MKWIKAYKDYPETWLPASAMMEGTDLGIYNNKFRFVADNRLWDILSKWWNRYILGVK